MWVTDVCVVSSSPLQNKVQQAKVDRTNRREKCLREWPWAELFEWPPANGKVLLTIKKEQLVYVLSKVSQCAWIFLWISCIVAPWPLALWRSKQWHRIIKMPPHPITGFAISVSYMQGEHKHGKLTSLFKCFHLSISQASIVGWPNLFKPFSCWPKMLFLSLSYSQECQFISMTTTMHCVFFAEWWVKYIPLTGGAIAEPSMHFVLCSARG